MTADASVRTALIETASRLIAADGSPGLTLRRLADEVGTSTMAIYTHFGGMEKLRREVRREAFARLREHLATVEDTGDPVADLAMLGAAYYISATTNPNLYRAMFMELSIDEADAAVGLDTFERLIDGVRRCIEGGGFRPAAPPGLAPRRGRWPPGAGGLGLARFLTPE